MSREWKPGDVALLKYRDVPAVLAIRVADDEDGHFRTARNTTATGEMSEWIRPLVVIDPESLGVGPKIIGDLLTACSNIVEREEAGREVKEVALLRRLADLFDEVTNPKPDEPTGLGAVVVTANGDRWVRAYDDGGRKQWIDHAGHVADYDDLAAVRILSPGVTP